MLITADGFYKKKVETISFFMHIGPKREIFLLKNKNDRVGILLSMDALD